MEEALKQRISTILKNKSITINALSKEINIPQVTLNKQINGDTSISANTILVLLDYFKDVSSEWLLRGEGEMIKSDKHCNREDEAYIQKIESLYDSAEKLLKDKYDEIMKRDMEIMQLKTKLNLLEQKCSKDIKNVV